MGGAWENMGSFKKNGNNNDTCNKKDTVDIFVMIDEKRGL